MGNHALMGDYAANPEYMEWLEQRMAAQEAERAGAEGGGGAAWGEFSPGSGEPGITAGAGAGEPAKPSGKMSKWEIAALTTAQTLPALMAYMKPQPRQQAPAVNVGGGKAAFAMPSMFGAGGGDKEKKRSLLARYLMGR